MLLPYLLIHNRLRKLRLVDLIMAVLPIAHNIDHKILAIFHSILDCQLHCPVNILNVLSIDMQDGHFVAFEHVSGVFGRPRINGSGCIANLVVSDDMY